MELNTWRANRALGRIGALIDDANLSIEMNFDLSEAVKFLTGTEKALTENFDPEFNTLTPRQAFWLGLVDKCGEPIGFQAYRFDDLGTMSVKDHLLRYWPRIYSKRSKAPVELSREQHRFMSKLTGRVVYAGELWIAPGTRRSGVASAFAKVGFLTALLHWELEWLYGFTNSDTGASGFTVALGATSAIPLSLNWVSAPTQVRPDMWFFYFSRSDLLDLIDVTLTAPQLAPTGLPEPLCQPAAMEGSADGKASDIQLQKKRAVKKRDRKKARHA